MKRIFSGLLPVLFAVFAIGGGTVLAEDCPTYYDDLYPGESICIYFCGLNPVPSLFLYVANPNPDLDPWYSTQPGCGAPCTDLECKVPTAYCFDNLIYNLNYSHPDYDTTETDTTLVGHFWDLVIYNYYCSSDTFCICLTHDYWLPVELTSFVASAGDGEVRLNWTTATEKDNNHWDIERATFADGPWTKIHEEPGQGTVSTETNYVYIDRTVQNGVTYWYRLTDVTLAGARESHSPVSATPGSLSDEVPREFVLKQNFPNPFNPSTTFEFGIPQAGFTTLKIHDLLGREVATVLEGNLEARQYQVSWKADNLPSGVYLYTLTTSDFSQTRKLVLMK